MANVEAGENRAGPAGWRDSRTGYGIVTRILHWTMAALFVWQFTSALLHWLAPDTPVEAFFWSMHFNFGILLWMLVLLRGAWGLANLARRPPYPDPRPHRWAVGFVHFSLYLLMIVVPTLALLRSYGSDRGMRWFGQQVFIPRAEKIESLTSLGNAWHGELGWVLLALIVSHVGAALWHGFVLRDGILQRMTRGYGRAAASR